MTTNCESADFWFHLFVWLFFKKKKKKKKPCTHLCWLMTLTMGFLLKIFSSRFFLVKKSKPYHMLFLCMFCTRQVLVCVCVVQFLLLLYFVNHAVWVSSLTVELGSCFYECILVVNGIGGWRWMKRNGTERNRICCMCCMCGLCHITK